MLNHVFCRDLLIFSGLSFDILNHPRPQATLSNDKTMGYPHEFSIRKFHTGAMTISVVEQDFNSELL
jgi:hypothetical protein